MQVPKLDEAATNQYLLPFEKKLGTNNRLYKSKFIRYVRWAQSDLHTFFRGNCRAEMKKNVTYNVDVQVDNKGNIRQAQCECAAGMGPASHCKHVVAVLFCTVMFFQSGTLNTELTCTERLQTFHKAKKFTGSPIKISDLSFGKMAKQPAPDSTCSLRFDPRPLHLRNHASYNDYIRNLAVNYSSKGSNNARMPIMQMVEPANPYAIIHDHDYCSLSGPDHLLKSLRVTEITQEECEILQNETRGQVSNPQWQNERLNRLTSSNFGRICKATERTDMANLAKLYTLPNKVKSASLEYGRTYENVAIEQYSATTGNRVQPCGIFINPDRPYLSSSPDGIIDSDLLIEVKCPYSARDRPITAETVPYLDLDLDHKLTLCKKHDYYFQIQGQLYCSKRNNCDFVVYTKSETKIIRIPRDDIFIEAMVSKLCAFYEGFFKSALLNKYLFRNYENFSFGKDKNSC